MNETFSRQIAANVDEVRARIADAAARSGRSADAVRLVAVSKYAAIGDGMVEAILAVGCVDLGESRPQLLLEKAAHYAALSIRWHLIGSLQRNKIRKILPVVHLVHSLDSLRLADAIDRIAAEENAPPVRCLLEIAISGEATKQGFMPDKLPAAMDELATKSRLRIEGLMCMSGLDAGRDETRRQFEAVRRLAETLRDRGTPPNVAMNELSMGMSDDFEIAVEQGATIVRIGSRLYRESGTISK